MATPVNGTIIAPNGCPVEDLPEDPTHLFSANGLTLDLPRIGWIASGVLTVISTLISFVLIYRHFQYYYKVRSLCVSVCLCVRTMKRTRNLTLSPSVQKKKK